MPEARLARVKTILAQLADADREHTVFGSSSHGYALHPPLTEAKVAAFERTHEIRLPDDYRAFVTRLGNGGAGPFYGVFRLGEMDGGAKQKRWRVGEVVGHPGRPFPHVEPWNWPADRIIALHDDETGALERDYWQPFDGALPVAHEGCALRDWLVVTGPEAGHMWHDATADFGGVVPWGEGKAAQKAHGMIWSLKTIGTPPRGARSPVAEARTRLGFLAWYERWLDLATALVARRG